MTVKDWVLLVAVIVGLIVAAGFVLAVGPAWWRGWKMGVKLPPMEVMGMKMRNAPVDQIFAAAAEAKRGGVEVEVRDLETQSLAGGDPRACVEALVEARKRGIEADWDSVRACDLAGRDVVAIVRAGVEPGKVIGAKEFEGRFGKRI